MIPTAPSARFGFRVEMYQNLPFDAGHRRLERQSRFAEARSRRAARGLFSLKIIRNKDLAVDRHLSYQHFGLAELKFEITSIIERS
jgi:hypothetical protein